MVRVAQSGGRFTCVTACEMARDGRMTRDGSGWLGMARDPAGTFPVTLDWGGGFRIRGLRTWSAGRTLRMARLESSRPLVLDNLERAHVALALCTWVVLVGLAPYVVTTTTLFNARGMPRAGCHGRDATGRHGTPRDATGRHGMPRDATG